MKSPTYLEQDCTLTLSEGLEEYYSGNLPEVKQFAKRVGPLLVDHDISHVIFGLGTTIEEESLLDTWTIRGTNITWKQIYEYAFNHEFKELTKLIVKDNGGWFNIIKIVINCIPYKLKIHFKRIPKMKKKWPYSNVTYKMMSSSIKDLREEYGIKIINY